MAKVPSTSPSFDKIGVDQQAAKLCFFARSANGAHNGSVAILLTIIGFFRKAAVPHEPTPSPISTPSIASQYSLGRLGDAA